MALKIVVFLAAISVVFCVPQGASTEPSTRLLLIVPQPLDFSGVALLLGNNLLVIGDFISASVSATAAAVEAAMAATTAAQNVAANAIAAEINSINSARAECAPVSRDAINTLMQEFSGRVNSCIGDDLNQLTIALESLELEAARARSNLISSAEGLVSCIEAVNAPTQILTCINQAVFDNERYILTSLTTVGTSLAGLLRLGSALPVQSRICMEGATVATQPSIARVLGDIGMCVATAAPAREN